MTNQTGVILTTVYAGTSTITAIACRVFGGILWVITTALSAHEITGELLG